MTESYVTQKVLEALESTGGDKRDAQKLLITWAVRDPSLLLGLTKPHLKGIVAAQIDHIAAGGSTKGEGSTKTHFSAGDVKEMVSSRPLGEKRSNLPPPKTSRRQANVMHQIAEAFRKRKS